MKKCIPTLLAVLFILVQLNAQSIKTLRDINSFQPMLMPEKGTHFMETNTGNTTGTIPPTTTAIPRTNVGILGTTIMDVQTYGSVPGRLVNYGDGVLSGIWMIGYDSDMLAWADRGTGYNHHSNGSWGTPPDVRIEGADRTGFPAFAGTSSGGEIVVTHKTPQPYEHWTYTKTTGETDWTQGAVPNDIPGGILWPRVSGDINSDYVHVIGITTPEAFGGMPYEGVYQQLVYSRSSDAGATWDMVNIVIPGADSSFYNTVAADAYAIDSKDNYVAVGIYSSWGDLAIFKSEDYGETWTKTIVNDFPLDKYISGDGYTTNDLVGSDFAGPDSLAIFTNDESGAILIDNDGQVHTWFGEMYVIDSGGLAFYPDWSGLRYWNESMGPNTNILIADLVDHDGSGAIEIEAGQFGSYFNSLTSFPSAGIDADNNIYLSYAGVTEEHLNTSQVQYYRHIYMLKTEDGGANWTEPYDMINPDFYPEPEFIPFIEAVYASIARYVDDKVHFTFQEDLSPGLVAWGDEDPAQTSSIAYFSVNPDDFSNATVSNDEIAGSQLFEMSVQPNPSKGAFNLTYELETSGNIQIILLNSLGQQVRVIENKHQATGVYNLPVPSSSDLTSGLYFVQIQQGDKSASAKVIIE